MGERKGSVQSGDERLSLYLVAAARRWLYRRLGSLAELIAGCGLSRNP